MSILWNESVLKENWRTCTRYIYIYYWIEISVSHFPVEEYWHVDMILFRNPYNLFTMFSKLIYTSFSLTMYYIAMCYYFIAIVSVLVFVYLAELGYNRTGHLAKSPRSLLMVTVGNFVNIFTWYNGLFHHNYFIFHVILTVNLNAVKYVFFDRFQV